MNNLRQTSQDCGAPAENSPPPAIDLARMQSATMSACSSESRSADTGSPGNKVCVTCGTRKTPMWRTNTDGQKTLCNACGVRLHREQKKAKIARGGPDAAKGKADSSVQLLPRSRSKSQSLMPDTKVAVSVGESHTKLQRKRSWQESLEPRTIDFSASTFQGARSAEQQSLYQINSSSVQQQKHQQQQQQQQQRARSMSWRSLNALSEPAGAQEACRLPQSLPVQFTPQMALPPNADLDPLDPEFLESINDPCSSRKDMFSYDLNAAGSCVTDDRSEQTLLFGHAHHQQQRHAQPLKAPHFSSPTGDCRPAGTSYGMSPTKRSHITLPLDMSTPDSHMWMTQEGYFL